MAKNEEIVTRTGIRPATLDDIEGLSVNMQTRYLERLDTKPEIEITPEMIAAGRECISSVWLDFVGPNGHRLWDSTLTAVFREMSAAQRRSRP